MDPTQVTSPRHSPVCWLIAWPRFGHGLQPSGLRAAPLLLAETTRLSTSSPLLSPPGMNSTATHTPQGSRHSTPSLGWVQEEHKNKILFCICGECGRMRKNPTTPAAGRCAGWPGHRPGQDFALCASSEPSRLPTRQCKQHCVQTF